MRRLILISVPAVLLLLAGCASTAGAPAAPLVPEATKPQGLAVTAVATTAVTAAGDTAAQPSPPASSTTSAAATSAPPAPASPSAGGAAAPPTETPGAPTPSSPPTSGPAWEVQTLLVAPGEPGRLYALVADSTGPLWASPASNVRLRISDDFGKTWSDFPGGLPVDAECMVNVDLDYAATDALYASACQGLFVWEGNAGWAKRSTELTNVIAVAFGQSDLVWAARVSDGVIRSDDGGRTWRAASNGLVTFSGMANLGFDPRDNRTLYGIIQPKYAGSYLRRGTSEGNWVTMPAPQDNATIETGMTIDGGSGALYVTTQMPPSGLWVSHNPNAADLAEVQWEKIRDFDATARVLLLASGWGPEGTALYANIWPDWYVGGAAPATGGLNRSLDGGYTWEALPTP
jgi:BNR/Asp-box repeat